MHAPPVQASPGKQAIAHVPQCAVSVIVLVQAPLQTVALAVGQLHAPAAHAAPVGQAIAHAPQLLGSFAVLTHVPLQTVLGGAQGPASTPASFAASAGATWSAGASAGATWSAGASTAAVPSAVTKWSGLAPSTSCVASPPPSGKRLPVFESSPPQPAARNSEATSGSQRARRP